ncbi:hypothetical protein ACTWP4_06655 [Gracilibacillus sp. D59]|uniref:hypothetical protein n=1 Tax=Gracilibacillus sp. D59 TaxID=3457434 RepID=UPI003FCC437B
MSQPVIDKIMVGKPKTFGNKDAKHPMEREWTTGIVKYSVKGDIWVGKTNLGGDGQADLKRHGGPEKAIFVEEGLSYPIFGASLFVLVSFTTDLG